MKIQNLTGNALGTNDIVKLISQELFRKSGLDLELLASLEVPVRVLGFTSTRGRRCGLGGGSRSLGLDGTSGCTSREAWLFLGRLDIPGIS